MSLCKYGTNGSAVMFDARHSRWLFFHRPSRVYAAYRLDQVMPMLGQVETTVTRDGFWAVGFVTYEAAPAFDQTLPVKSGGRLPLLWFGIYEQPRVITLPEFADRGCFSELPWKPTMERDAYDAAIARIKHYIRDGDTYQVNYTLRLRASFSGSPWSLFLRLIAAQPTCYGAYIDTPQWSVCSASPESFLEWADGELCSRPMKGTARRGLWADDDRRKALALETSPKDRAENVMIVDMVRNDLGRIAESGSVRVENLFRVEQYATLWQMVSTVRCRTTANLAGLFTALFPPASITGAPKRRTMEIISELETTPRGVYTGAIGFLTPERCAQFNVAIRTVTVDKQNAIAEYGTGSGIVWDSTAASEFDECLVKAQVLTHRLPSFSLLETLLWTPKKGLFLLDRHLQRLQQSAVYFARPLAIDAIRRLLLVSVQGLTPVPHRLRLVVAADGTPEVDVQPVPPPPARYRIGLAKRPIDPADPFLYHKTTHRMIYQQALQVSPGCDDVLLWNPQGEITESCIANVLIEWQGRWVTPPVRCGLLAGTYRDWLLAQGRIEEKVIRVDELTADTRICLINSVRQRWSGEWVMMP